MRVYGVNDTEFTFQSGTIQAFTQIPFSQNICPLHSNLVQFKRVKAMISIQDGIYFTFQSGTIQAVRSFAI